MGDLLDFIVDTYMKNAVADRVVTDFDHTWRYFKSQNNGPSGSYKFTKEDPMASAVLKDTTIVEKEINNMSDVTKLFFSWVGKQQQKGNKLFKTLPDFTGIAYYLETGNESAIRSVTMEDINYLKHTAMFQLFVLFVGGLLLLGFSVKYATRKWNEYLKKRSVTPDQKQVERKLIESKLNPSEVAISLVESTKLVKPRKKTKRTKSKTKPKKAKKSKRNKSRR